MDKYWESEEPITVTTSKNTLKLYSVAGMLAVSRPDWLGTNGVVMSGKTVTINLLALKEADDETRSKAEEIFGHIIDVIKE